MGASCAVGRASPADGRCERDGGSGAARARSAQRRARRPRRRDHSAQRPRRGPRMGPRRSRRGTRVRARDSRARCDGARPPRAAARTPAGASRRTPERGRPLLRRQAARPLPGARSPARGRAHRRSVAPRPGRCARDAPGGRVGGHAAESARDALGHPAVRPRPGEPHRGRDRRRRRCVVRRALARGRVLVGAGGCPGGARRRRAARWRRSSRRSSTPATRLCARAPRSSCRTSVPWMRWSTAARQASSSGSWRPAEAGFGARPPSAPADVAGRACRGTPTGAGVVTFEGVLRALVFACTGYLVLLYGVHFSLMVARSCRVAPAAPGAVGRRPGHARGVEVRPGREHHRPRVQRERRPAGRGSVAARARLPGVRGDRRQRRLHGRDARGSRRRARARRRRRNVEGRRSGPAGRGVLPVESTRACWWWTRRTAARRTRSTPG